MALLLACWAPDRAVQVRVLTGIIVLYFCARHFTSLHFTFAYKVEALVSGHLREVENVSTTGAGPYRNVQIQSLYELEFKQGFVKAALVELSAYESVRSESFYLLIFEVCNMFFSTSLYSQSAYFNVGA